MRDSNFELLRLILCYLLILHHHQFHMKIFRGLHPFYKMLVTILFILSINCFIFITGYFAKNSKWRPSRVLILLIEITTLKKFEMDFMAGRSK